MILSENDLMSLYYQLVNTHILNMCQELRASLVPTLKDGTSVTLWSGTTAEENVVSAAQAALDDVQDTRSAVYAYSNGDGKYSRYSPELQAKLRAFIGA